jgi:hypothetical protein
MENDENMRIHSRAWDVKNLHKQILLKNNTCLSGGPNKKARNSKPKIAQKRLSPGIWAPYWCRKSKEHVVCKQKLARKYCLNLVIFYWA